MPIVDPGIKIDRGYPAYDNGIKADVFLKDSNQEPYIGNVCFSHVDSIRTIFLPYP